MNLRSLILSLFFISFLAGCGSGSGSSSSSSKSASINGIISTSGPTPSPIEGATVSVSGKNAITDTDGKYEINGVSAKDSQALTITHPDFLPVDKQVSTPSGATSAMNFKLSPITFREGFNSTEGFRYNVNLTANVITPPPSTGADTASNDDETISPKDGDTPAIATPQSAVSDSGAPLTTITLPANAYVDANTGKNYEGEIGIITRYFDVSNGEDSTVFPNSFKIEGDKLLHSYGAIGIYLYGTDGQWLKLASGKEVVIQMFATALAPAGSTMKMWHYNAANGIWKAENKSIIRGDRYRTIVNHLGTLSLGIESPATGTVTGCIVNTRNEPQQHAQAELFGSSWISSDLDSDEDGRFSVTVSAGEPLSLRGSKNGFVNGLASTSAISVAADETLDLTECIVLTSPTAKFTVTWGDAPNDLDAHLLFTRKPVVNDAGEEVAAADIDVSVSNPIVDDITLSADSANGSGPEIIDIAALTDGDYTFSVHHFDGLSNISDSPTTATLDISGQGVLTLTAGEGATGIDDVWTIWEVSIKSGAITVKEVNKIEKKPLAKVPGSVDISVKGID